MVHHIGCGLALALAVMIGVQLNSLLSIPIVYTSWSTKECVRVEDETGEFSCNHLPEKYLHEWAK